MTKRKELKAIVNEKEHAYYKSEFAKHGLKLQEVILKGLDQQLKQLNNSEVK